MNPLEALNDLESLQDDWDGLGAVAPTSETLNLARNWFVKNKWFSCDRVTASPDGVIVAEWHGDHYEEIEFSPDGGVSWMSETNGKYEHKEL